MQLLGHGYIGFSRLHAFAVYNIFPVKRHNGLTQNGNAQIYTVKANMSIIQKLLKHAILEYSQIDKWKWAFRGL